MAGDISAVLSPNNYWLGVEKVGGRHLVGLTVHVLFLRTSPVSPSLEMCKPIHCLSLEDKWLDMNGFRTVGCHMQEVIEFSRIKLQ